MLKKITIQDVRNHSTLMAGVPAAIGGCSGALVSAILKSVIKTDKMNFIGRSILFVGRWGLSSTVALGVADKLIDFEDTFIRGWNRAAERQERRAVDIHDDAEEVEES